MVLVCVAALCGFGPAVQGDGDSGPVGAMLPTEVVHLLGHSAVFKVPFFREWVILHGHGTVGKETMFHILRKGDTVAFVPGGAKEAIVAAHDAHIRLILKNRKGFAKVAMQTGPALVPVFGFGEMDLFQSVQHPLLRKVQAKLQRVLAYALPVFCGLPFFPLLPKRRQLHTVVGAPVRPARKLAAGEQPLQAEVDELHARYLAALSALYEANNPEPARQLIFV